jgi:SET domain-containing protein
MIVVRKTKNRGLGVFATQTINKGTLIECCRVIVVPRTEIIINGTASVMRHYVVEWESKIAVPTGFGCFYNHSYSPNAIHIKHINLSEMHFHALKDILPNEEITINYGGVPSYTDPLWFEVKDS